jgi:hypothetical protein
LPQARFLRTTFRRVKQVKIYENEAVYYGVLVLKVRRSTWLRYKIKGIIAALLMPDMSG